MRLAWSPAMAATQAKAAKAAKAAATHNEVSHRDREHLQKQSGSNNKKLQKRPLIRGAPMGTFPSTSDGAKERGVESGPSHPRRRAKT